MHFDRFKLGVILILLLLAKPADLAAQWGAPYANSWINYEKPYVKITVNKKGIHRVALASLPADFPKSQPEKLQLWHRGKQVAILSTANNELLFYGVPNDGATDSLLYRPMSSRMNPHFSMYSDQSAYFLVAGESAGLRARTSTAISPSGATTLSSAMARNTNLFQQEYSLTTEQPIRPNFFNSFFEYAASRTGKFQSRGKLVSYPFTLGNLAGRDSKTSLEMLVHGRSNSSRTIEVYIGKDEQSLRMVAALSTYGFAAEKFSFDLVSSDITQEGKGVFALKSVSADALDRYSLAYFELTYARDFDLKGQKTQEWSVPVGPSAAYRPTLKNFSKDAKVLDITDPDTPVIIPGNLENILLVRGSNALMNILVTSEVTSVATENIKLLNFRKYDLVSSNYIIITSENLIEGAGWYADYRASQAGGAHKTSIVRITDVYDQFNYGEPSPVAIRRFASYLTAVGPREKYLLFLGKSITHNERMKRELPDEVPTIGYPGSDVLLVEGLGGVAPDVPAFPIGRIPAVTNENIRDYLNKVKEYEGNANGEIGWRKRILHLNGGKSSSEVTQLKNMLGALVPSVTNGVAGGEVTAFVKQQGIVEVEKVNITPEVNSGVGLITYFGHGSVTITDLDMGYATDESRAYANRLRYPMMYFNGCGVGNIFSGRSNPAPDAKDRYSLSMDWILAAKRGAIALVANTFESFVSPSEKYLRYLYDAMFVDPATVNQPIGRIQQKVAEKILLTDRGVYTVGNLHQSMLQGDPALRLVTVDRPDYALDPYGSVFLSSESPEKTIEKSGNLKLRVAVANQGRYLKGVAIPVELRYIYADGTIIKNEKLPSFAMTDTLETIFPNTGKRLLKIQVVVDPQSTLTEISRKNNVTELLVDWEVVKKKTVYSAIAVKDIVAPFLNVAVNNRVIKSQEVILPNPVISVTLEDDRLVSRDTALIELFVKPCQDESCNFKRVRYSEPEVLRLDSIDNNRLRLVYRPDDMTEGVYELLVKGQDRSGNSVVQPYRIQYSVEDVDAPSDVIVSPNPASSYVRFEAAIGKAYRNGSTVTCFLYDTRGKLILSKEMNLPRTERHEWYLPLDTVPAGLYAFRVEILPVDSQRAKFVKGGKVVVAK